MKTSARRVLAGIALVTSGSLLVACASSEDAAEPSGPAVALPEGLAEPGDSIPETTLSGGLSPYGDELLAAAGVTRGYFDEVGIAFAEEPYGAQADLIASVTPLLNGQIDVGSGYTPSLISQMDDVDEVVGFAIQDVFYGYRIMAPEGEYVTLAEEMEDGASYEEAMTTVLAQLDGQDVLLRDGVVPTFYQLITGTGSTGMDAWNITYLTNPDLVRAAQAGQAQFVSPTGAVEIVRLQQDGWESLVSLPEVVEHSPAEDTVALRATFSGYLTTTSFAEDNWETLLRYTSVMYRLIDDFEADPVGVAGDYVDYLNSYTGSSLTAEELAQTFDGLYSLHSYEDAAAFFDDEDYAFHYDTVMGAQIDALATQGVIGEGHSPSQLSIAAEIYASLEEYRVAAEELLAELPADAATAAQAQYDARNYLDAYRLAAAASEAS